MPAAGRRHRLICMKPAGQTGDRRASFSYSVWFVCRERVQNRIGKSGRCYELRRNRGADSERKWPRHFEQGYSRERFVMASIVHGQTGTMNTVAIRASKKLTLSPAVSTHWPDLPSGGRRTVLRRDELVQWHLVSGAGRIIRGAKCRAITKMDICALRQVLSASFRQMVELG